MTELQGSYQVAVVGTDNKIEIRTVKVGDRTGTLWIIVDGLKQGETVVAEGTQKVRPGVAVNPFPFTILNRITVTRISTDYADYTEREKQEQSFRKFGGVGLLLNSGLNQAKLSIQSV